MIESNGQRTSGYFLRLKKVYFRTSVFLRMIDGRLIEEQGWQIWYPNWVRCALNGKILWLFKINFNIFWLGEPKYTEIWSGKVPVLSYLGSIWTHFWLKSDNPGKTWLSYLWLWQGCQICEFWFCHNVKLFEIQTIIWSVHGKSTWKTAKMRLFWQVYIPLSILLLTATGAKLMGPHGGLQVRN